MPKAQASAKPVSPAALAVVKANEPEELLVALIALYTEGTPYRWATTNAAQDVPTPGGATVRVALNALFGKIAEKRDFAPEDRDPIAVTARAVASGAVIERWFTGTGKSGRRYAFHKLAVNDPNYVREGKGKTVANPADAF